MSALGRLPLGVAMALLMCALGAPRHIAAQAPAQRAAGNGAAPPQVFLDTYCVTCHNARLRTGNLVLEKLDPDIAAAAPVFEKVAWKLRAGLMPPPGRLQPDEATRRTTVAAIEAALDAAALAAPDPGYVATHRISRLEYVNAIRDLLDLEVDGEVLLPADSAGAGFDNDSGVLKVTPALMARYLSSATKISQLAMGSPALRPVTHVHRISDYLRQETRMSEELPFGTYGGDAFHYTFPRDGDYVFKLRLKRANLYDVIRGLNRDVEIEVRLDRALVRRFKIEARHPGYDWGILVAPEPDDLEGRGRHEFRVTADDGLEFRIPVRGGTRLVSAAFTGWPLVFQHVSQRRPSIKNAVDNDDADSPGIDTVEISGPYDATGAGDTATRRRILVCQPQTARDEEPCARRILQTLARRAYRRPVTATEVEDLLAFYRRGRGEGSFDDGIEGALEALLASPGFLLRVEESSADAEPGTIERISDLELASRLSFFLWASIPDEELLSLAERGALFDQDVLEQQVRRMLADPRATAFVNSFTGQWLITRNAATHELDPGLFPEVDGNLEQAIVREMELFVESQVGEDRSVLDLLRADYTFLNERLARHYGIPQVYGSHFRRVQLDDERRFGLLGKGAVHMVTSYANRTSVVLRGKWVLESLLDSPPPSPPANVPSLADNDASKPTTLRERLEQHRSSPVCATCHSVIDPLGFPLESFDASGRWRTMDGDVPLDSSSVLPDGTQLDDVADLRRFLVEKRGDVFLRTVTTKLLGYALRREVEHYDMPTVREVMRNAAGDGYRWSSLITGLVKSTPFGMRRVPAADADGIRVAAAGAAGR